MMVDWLPTPRTRRMGRLLALCLDVALWALIVGAGVLGLYLTRDFGA